MIIRQKELTDLVKIWWRSEMIKCCWLEQECKEIKRKFPLGIVIFQALDETCII